MGSRNLHKPWILPQSPFLVCLSVFIVLVLPYLFFLEYAGKPDAIEHELSNEILFSVPDNETMDMEASRVTDDEAVFAVASERIDKENNYAVVSNAVASKGIDNSPMTAVGSKGKIALNSSFSNKNEVVELSSCDPSKARLKVFMYDLPPEFHFGLLDWKRSGNSVWPDVRTSVPRYPGGLNIQHSIEYWLTLDLLSTTTPGWTGPCTAVRVESYREADVVFVPFFSSLSYNRHSKIEGTEKISRNHLLQLKLLKFLFGREEWKRSGGRDHIILAHHPNSMLDARAKLWPCTFILSDFGRYSPQVANVKKDIIAPYKHMIKTYINDSAGFDVRPTLLYFQGAIYRKDGGSIRQKLFYLLKKEKDVHFSFGSVSQNGVNEASRGMHKSKFCLNIAGDTPSSNRLFDAIASHCVPVIISDDIELPYEDVLNYSKFCVFVRSSDAVKKGFLIKLIRGIGRDEWTQMWQKLKEVEGYFEYQYPSKKDDAVQMIWQAIARKVPSIRLKVHRSRRFSSLPNQI